MSTDSVADGKSGFELIEATVADVHAAFTAGSLSARQLTQMYLDRIEALDRCGPALNSIIAVNPKKYSGLNYDGAMDLINWITSPDGQKTIADFKVSGEQLFFPTAAK